MGQSLLCQLCGREIPQQGHYVIRIEVFADPAMPNMTAEQIQGMDFEKILGDLFAQMNGMSADDLQDQVYRKFEYRVCGECQKMVLANPLGRPRNKADATN